MSVVDASVVLKWFTEEDYTDKALFLREEYFQGKRGIAAPDILIYEVANALRYHPRSTAEDVKAAVHSLLDMNIEIIVPTSSMIDTAIDIAIEDDVTCYDAVYIALALELGEDLFTADEKFVSRLSSNRRQSVKLLKDLEKSA